MWCWHTDQSVIWAELRAREQTRVCTLLGCASRLALRWGKDALRHRETLAAYGSKCKEQDIQILEENIGGCTLNIPKEYLHNNKLRKNFLWFKNRKVQKLSRFRHVYITSETRFCSAFTQQAHGKMCKNFHKSIRRKMTVLRVDENLGDLIKGTHAWVTNLWEAAQLYE